MVQHYLEIYPEPFTISFDPNSYVIPPPPFPHEKAPANQVTDAFVNIIIPVQNNLSSQVPHPGPRRTIIPRNTEGQPSIFQNNRSHRNIFHPVIKPLIERDLYHRTITSHLKDITFADIEEQGFMPVYERQEITDDLHEPADSERTIHS